MLLSETAWTITYSLQEVGVDSGLRFPPQGTKLLRCPEVHFLNGIDYHRAS